MRSDTEQSPQSCSRSASTMLRRACALSSGATASSRSSITMSAPRLGAFSSIRTLLPGTASSLRCRRGGLWVIEHLPLTRGEAHPTGRDARWQADPPRFVALVADAQYIDGTRGSAADCWVFPAEREYSVAMTPPTDLPSLNPPQRLLAGPGPSNVEPSMLAA